MFKIEKVKEFKNEVNEKLMKKFSSKKDGGMTYILEILGVATVILAIIVIANNYSWSGIFNKLTGAVETLVDKVVALWK